LNKLFCLELIGAYCKNVQKSRMSHNVHTFNNVAQLDNLEVLRLHVAMTLSFGWDWIGSGRHRGWDWEPVASNNITYVIHFTLIWRKLLVPGVELIP